MSAISRARSKILFLSTSRITGTTNPLTVSTAIADMVIFFQYQRFTIGSERRIYIRILLQRTDQGFHYKRQQGNSNACIFGFLFQRLSECLQFCDIRFIVMGDVGNI